jgi:hypothetical protein
MRPAKGRWEALHILDLYIVHPDGSGLKRIGGAGGSCGGPKWSSDSRRVIAYCMNPDDTLANQIRSIATGETRLVAIDVRTGAVSPIASGPGVKIAPVWPRQVRSPTSGKTRPGLASFMA